MCGFTGFVLNDQAAVPEAARLERMARTLVHRGPDDEGLVIRGNCALGFRRLSIIDLAGGHQPIYNETEDVAVLCNGEIYNFRELREGLEARGHRFRTASDAETVVHLYEEKGPDFVHDLVGMFAICIADWRKPGGPSLLLCRDRLGIKPLYWSQTAEGLFFGSEAKALLASGAVGRDLRARSLLEYLILGFTTGSDSAWSGIQRLRPGHLLEWRAGTEPRVRQYWDLPLEQRSEPVSDSEVLEWIDRVVDDRLVSDVPLGAFLSGGIDSSAVVTSMASSTSEPVIACSVGFHERSHDELELARATARGLSAVHHTQVLAPDPALAVETLPWFYDEPLADSSTVPTYLVSKMAREHVTVALSGDGGDEVFGGYRRYIHDVAENRLRDSIGAGGRRLSALGARMYPKMDWAPRFLRAKTFLANVANDPARAYWNSLSQFGRLDALALLAPELRHALGDFDPFDAFEDLYKRPRGVDSLYRAQYADVHTSLTDGILVKVDRASMAASLEVRVPFLDHRFVERFAALPTVEKVRAGRGKHRLREALRSRLSHEVLDGTKRGFDTPLRGWIQGPLQGAVREAIETLPANWFDRETLRNRLDEHTSGRRDHANLLWSLLVLEHWRRCHDVNEVVL